MKIVPVLILSVAFFLPGIKLTFGQEVEAPSGRVESYPADDWTTAPADFFSAHWDEAKLGEAEQKWQQLRDRGQSTGLMVVHRGYVIREFGDCETPVACHSVRKSFLSAVFGAWIEDSDTVIDELLTKTVSEIPLSEDSGIPEAYQNATLQHLLKSSSGMPLPAEYESKSNYEKRMQNPALPGEAFAYSNWDFNALGTAFHTLTGADIFQTFDESIVAPIGMQDFVRADHTRYFPDDGRKRKSRHFAYLFQMSARDRARLGLLYLAGGKWRDQRIIDEDWFTRSITDTIQVRKGPLDYGYMWWIGVDGQKQYSFPGDRTYSARGNGGQYIFVIPSRDLVIVHARDTGPKGGDTEFDGNLFNKVLHAIADAQKPPIPGTPLDFADKCKTLVPQLQKRFHVPGVAMAMVRNGEIIWSGEFGVLNGQTREPVTATTRFEAASMSKPVFAYGAMKLVEAGKLDLDRPLVDYLNEPYLKGDDRHKKITARMVLSHRSGFPNWRKGGYSTKTQPPAPGFEPGTKQGYSGEGFTLLQKAVEEITAQTLDEFTTGHILQPIGLGDSRFVWDNSAQIAAAHNDDGSLRRATPRYLIGNSAYSMFTTATDYAKFLIEMMKEDRSAAHSLSAGSLETMLTSHSNPEDKRNFALSWVIRPKPQSGYSHTGSNSGFRCGSWFDPDRNIGLVIMTNSVGGEQLRDRLFEFALGSW